jgi:hypothetical protein
MKRGEVLGKAIADYRTFFYNKDVDDYKKTITEFIRANEALSDDEFFTKFNQQFGMVETLHKALSREYLSRIASGVNTIKIIAIIYLVASIIAAIAIAAQLAN